MKCPKCKTSLPEHEELEYRFCPHCGAEIIESETQSDDSFQTIPPDFNERVEPEPQDAPDPVTSIKQPDSSSNQTIEPKISSQDKKHSAIRPPAGPPPASFFRTKKSPDK